jgi:NTE family protein
VPQVTAQFKLTYIFHDTDFDELLKDYIPRSSKVFYENVMMSYTLPLINSSIGVPIAFIKRNV